MGTHSSSIRKWHAPSDMKLSQTSGKNIIYIIYININFQFEVPVDIPDLDLGEGKWGCKEYRRISKTQGDWKLEVTSPKVFPAQKARGDFFETFGDFGPGGPRDSCKWPFGCQGFAAPVFEGSFPRPHSMG